MYAGKNNYIADVSDDSYIRAKQLWQFLTGKILFRLSCISQGQIICSCGIHTVYPFIDIPCTYKQSGYTLLDYPCNIKNDGYTYNYFNLKGSHKFVFNNILKI